MEIPHKSAILLHKLTEAGCGPIRRQGNEFRCRCPAHDDRGPSLYVGVGTGAVLLRCLAGCPLEDICNRLDHAVADLFYPDDEPLVEPDCDGAIEIEPCAGDVGTASSAAASAGAAGLRSAIYSQLLGDLELCMAHFDALRRRGLSADEIGRRGYRTIDAGRIRRSIDQILGRHPRETVLGVPGFSEREGRVLFSVTRGFLIPVRDLTGSIVALKVRHDQDYSGPKYTWASGRGASCGNVVHIPLGVESPQPLVRLTEGELKADVATALSGVPTISAPGVGTWALAVPVLRAMGARAVRLAFDRDGKPGTLAATEKALFGLTRDGFVVELEWWDGNAGKGIDDALAAEARVETVTGLAAAVRVRDALSPPAPADEDSPEPEPEPFPVDVFPPALAAFCREVAEATATPPDFAGLVMLVTSGAAIGNSRAVCLKENVWYESPRFYGATVGDPASGKTPAMDAVVKPYQALQLRLLRDYKLARAHYDRARNDYEAALKENRAGPPEDIRSLPSVPDEPTRPERFVVMDATVESLAPLLEENPRGLLMPQDEGVAWVRGMGQYKGGRGNDRQFWLSNWSGKSHMVDRKSQGMMPISIPRPFVNVVCGIPPDMLSELADCQGRNDGFLHRVLFVFPRAASGTAWTEVTVTDPAKRAWETTLAGLRLLAMTELDDGVPGYQVVRFSPEAKECWVAWWDVHAAEIRGPELPVELIGPWGKLKAYAARLALVLHYLWLVQAGGDETDLGAVSVERAVRLFDYFKMHLRLVYGRLRQTSDDSHMLELLDWIRRRGGQCTPRDLANSKKVTPTDRAKKLLRELEERGYGRVEWREASNKKKVQWFVLDPT
jgi:hypothetical protein